MLSGAGLIVPPQVYGGRWKRTVTQANASFPATDQADFDVAIGTPIGVRRSSAGVYELQVPGVWLITAQMMLLVAPTGQRPRIEVFDATAGEFLFYQDVSSFIPNAGAGTTAVFTVAVHRRFGQPSNIEFYWNTDTASADLVSTAGIGCEVDFAWLSP